MVRHTVGRDPLTTGLQDRRGAPAFPPPEEPRGHGALIAVLGILLVGALAWALIATFADEESAGPEAGISLSDLASDPEGLFGSRVVVSGEVSDVVGGEEAALPAGATPGRGFVIGDVGQSVLVVGTRVAQLTALSGDEDLAEGDVVQVTGMVREFDLAALEEDLGADLADDAFAPFEDRPVLVASAVDLVPTTARRQGEQVMLSADELTDSPSEYLAQRITVRDFAVGEPDDILSPRAATLDDDVLIVGGSGPTDLSPGVAGTLTGTLIEASTARMLDTIDLPQGATSTNLFEEIGIDEQAFGEYEYVLVADGFRPGG